MSPAKGEPRPAGAAGRGGPPSHLSRLAELDAATARRLLGILLMALTGLRALYAAGVNLAPQEAYYWQYARHLALSYLDHPPMTAWSIALSTGLFGTSELTVRLPALLGGVVLTILLYRLGERLFSPAAGLLAAVTANATVLFGIGAVVLTPDVPLLVFWTAALVVLCEVVLEDGRGPGRLGWRWLLLGVLTGLALLSKYTAGLLPVQILATALLLPRGRRALRTPWPYLGVLLALLVFSPVVIWNLEHGLASFAFQTTRRASEVAGIRWNLVARYLGLQAAAVTPVLYLALWWALVVTARRALGRDQRFVLLSLATLPGVLLFTAVSPFHWVKMNWVAPAYAGTLVAFAGLLMERWRRPWPRRAAGLAVAVGAVMTLAIYLMPLWPAIPFSEKDNLVTGWDQLADAVEPHLETRRAAGGEPFVIAWEYKAASELAFYLPGRPETTSDTALGGAGLMYDFWFEPAAHVGRDALVVSDRRRHLPYPSRRLSRHCDHIERLEPVTVRRGAREVTTFDLWWCEGWRPADG